MSYAGGLSRLSDQRGMDAMLGGSRINPFSNASLYAYVPHSTV